MFFMRFHIKNVIYTRSVQKVSSHVTWKNKNIYWRHKLQETLYIGQWCLSPLQSRHVGTSHSSPNCHQLPHCIFLNLINRQISSLSKVILLLRKARSCKVSNLGCRVLGDRWVTWVIWCSAKISALDVMHEQTHCCDETANH